VGYGGFAGASNIGSNAFAGAAFDGLNLWISPDQSDRIVRFSTYDYTMTSFSKPSLGTLGRGVVYDGDGLWWPPRYSSTAVYRMSLGGNYRTMLNLPRTYEPQSEDFIGIVFDGVSIWMIPCSAGAVVRLVGTQSVDLVAGRYIHGVQLTSPRNDAGRSNGMTTVDSSRPLIAAGLVLKELINWPDGWTNPGEAYHAATFTAFTFGSSLPTPPLCCASSPRQAASHLFLDGP